MATSRAKVLSPWFNATGAEHVRRRRRMRAALAAAPAIRCDGCGAPQSLWTRHPFTEYWCSSECQARRRPERRQQP
jgi:hypothetical protein